ncbi:NAD(P)-binding domain-containing protein [Pseudomonas putida]|uniref:NAD(P)-binding domain-containing protein n=1 Tax=Pseudomonas putida TaxID=303 RepID=UPI0008194587|nr:NAD(P)-binding domain-containing protein [Pseudomonas putida]OCT29461.1 pyrroline-5-carboxylate reductase [Pseudomonas putida]OCT31157.1 pyrroline-5-carboxylate reductase [Pseudomonas putida]OCT33399.1 pyrroline-5-carboxylate reductase [Pseudomonas putida]OCT39845.1 pyrroline-5-carboxylate reductase [Pseudomonas putida]
MQSLGFLGVGELSEKVVIGLRQGGYSGTILLSPRNAERAAMLAREYQCQVLASNQAVVDQAEAVVLGVRPGALHEVASQVCLRPGQRLLSLAAGIGLGQLAKAFPGAHCVRVMLSYAAQFNQSTVVIYPPDAPTEHCLETLGSQVVLEDEAAFELATVAGCMNGWFYFLLHDLQQWLSDKGLPAEQARALVLGNLQDCVASAQRQPGQSLKALGEAIATPGTFTADGLAVLMHQPVSATWGAACEVVLDGLLTRSRME